MKMKQYLDERQSQSIGKYARASFAVMYMLSAIAIVVQLYVGNGENSYLLPMIPAYGILLINMLILTMFVSALSIVLPVAVNGLLGILYVMGGLLYSILDIYSNIAGGFSGKLFKVLEKILPNLNGIQNQAQNLILGNTVQLNLILTGLFTACIFSLGIVFFRKKEA